MNFAQAVRRNLTTAAYVDFSGRASRSEYWWFYLFTGLVSLGLGLLVGSLGDTPAALLLGLLPIGLIIPGLATLIRRMHDSGRSGWWLLTALIPVLGVISLLVLTLLPSTPGANRYGPGRSPSDPFLP